MSWLEGVLDTLAKSPVCGYRAKAPGASEPTALAALALYGHERTEPASKAAAWLADLQAKDGSVGLGQGLPTPPWPTGLALLVWAAAKKPSPEQGRWQEPIDRAVAWALKYHGETMPRTKDLGHDTTLTAWPWVDGTHSWLEPTAFFVLALKAVGQAKHARTREAVRLLIDRQLETGGCNYGNTVVLGQPLRAQVQPTGLAMLALAGEQDTGGRISLSLRYTRGALSDKTTASSLCWGLLGLAAHGQTPLETQEWLAMAYRYTHEHGDSPHKLALLALAALEERAPIITLSQRTAAS